MKRTIWLLLVLMVIFTACGSTQLPAQPAAAVTAAPTFTPEFSPTAAAAVAPSQPVVIPVTGEKSAEPALDAWVNAADGLNLRVGPGLNHRILAILSDGQQVRLEGRSRDGSWIVVRLPDGTAGWAYSTYLKTSAQLSALPLVEGAGGPVVDNPVVVQPNPISTVQPSLPGKYTLYMTISANQAVVSMTKMPASSEVTMLLSARGGQSITVASGKTDGNGAASFSFPMPRFWLDGSRITQTSLLLTASTADGSVNRTASITYDPGE